MTDRAVTSDADDAFQAIAASLDYPMFVVTTATAGERSGCLVGFLTQCSIDPRRFLVCISKKNHTFRVAMRARTLVVHVLRADQHELARRFGEETGDEVDKFANVEWQRGPDGVPVLADCDWFSGDVLERIDLGDHVGHLVAVTAAARVHAGAAQLGFHAVQDMTPGHDA
jgi:flavin reductase (DIM6/NTAB) family NADH-FMN oxidoreductase RutF